MWPDPIRDALDRPVISDSIKSKIAMAFQDIPKGKKAALLVIADEHGTRGVVAAKIGHSGDWKVAAGGGIDWAEKKPYGYVALAGSW